ncbi:MAG: hydrolase [Planctomycetota bacterium]
MVRNQVSRRRLDVPAAGVELEGHLAIPAGARGAAVLAHGPGRGRYSPRERYLSGVLQGARIATLLIDLLTEDEQRLDLLTGAYRLDAELQGARLRGALDWLVGRLPVRRFALLGAGPAAAAAVVASIPRRSEVCALVLRGGSTEAVERLLPLVGAPTLLIAGGQDPRVVRESRRACEALTVPHRLRVLPGVCSFREPRAMEETARLTRDWCLEHLPTRVGIQRVGS